MITNKCFNVIDVDIFIKIFIYCNIFCVSIHVGIVGEKSENGDLYMWTHKKFEIGYNGDQVINEYRIISKLTTTNSIIGIYFIKIE